MTLLVLRSLMPKDKSQPSEKFEQDRSLAHHPTALRGISLNSREEEKSAAIHISGPLPSHLAKLAPFSHKGPTTYANRSSGCQLSQ